MWSNSMLKEKAKEALKRYYWWAVLVTVIVALFTGGFSNTGTRTDTSDSVEEIMEQITSGSSGDYTDDYFSDNGTGNNDVSDNGSGNNGEDTFSDEFTDAFIDGFESGSGMDFDGIETFFGAVAAVFIVIILVALAIGIAYSVFVALPITVGQWRFYLEARRGNVGVGNIFSQFRSGNYLSTVKAMFFTQLEIFLWSLLFVIPGIIKSYEYYLVPFIIAENPQMDVKRAKEISRRTMDGEKLNLWLLQLSFIGWWLLGAILIIGSVFVQPYVNATMTEFYCCMRQKALATGIADSSELFDDFDFYSVGNSFSPYPDSTNYQAPGQQNNGYQPTNYYQQGAPQQSETPSQPDFTPGVMDEISFEQKNDANEGSDYNGPEIK